MKRTFLSLVLLSAFFVETAQAFCGFYVGGAESSLYNDATMVVMMRHGTKTILSMQNTYQGPPEAFAMIVPVPEVLQKENVKTLPHDIFKRVDRLAAPRLVEYWEQDPCKQPMLLRTRLAMASNIEEEKSEGGVTIEAQFKVAEYDIVILSAQDSNGLDAWLRSSGYNIPDNAAPALRPYVEKGTKFFVAKVDPSKVKFENDRAVLSPLRIEYDSPEFSLPVRLGMLNSKGQQDLIVHTLALGQRYEAANYANVTIPTNIKVKNSVRENFGGFYDALFTHTIEQNPKSVVTEYSWDAGSCDPCPEQPLSDQELKTLGADVAQTPTRGFVLTRMHYRYGRDELGEDIVFKEAAPIVGGRGTPDKDGSFADHGRPNGNQINNFQGRYAILHPWEKPPTCSDPKYSGQWGGPDSARQPPKVTPSQNSLAPRSKTPVVLGSMVAEDVPSLKLQAGDTTAAVPATQDAPDMPKAAQGEGAGCAGCSIGSDPQAASVFAVFGLLAFMVRRRR